MTARIRRIVALGEAELDGLASLLVDAVEGGSSVGFLTGFDLAAARSWWSALAPAVASGERCVLVGEDETGIVGTAQLVLAQPPNQPHRADVSKVLVLRRARGAGVGTALMGAIDEHARAAGRTLLMLDTTTGQPAERLYRRLGWQEFGVVPGHALMPDGSSSDTTFFYKRLTR